MWLKSILVGIILIALGCMFGCISTKRKPLKSYNQVMADNRTFDAIIVPGVPFNNGSWDSTMKARVLWSYYLYKKGIARNVIYSGAAVYSPYIEAKIMGLYAEQLGIPSAHIFSDTLAEHSTENVYYSYLLARQLGFKSIALATDPFQARMLRSFIRKRFATEIVILPFVQEKLKDLNHLNPEIDPRSAYVDAFVPITERQGFWKRLRGTLGKHLEWEQQSPRKMKEL